MDSRNRVANNVKKNPSREAVVDSATIRYEFDKDVSILQPDHYAV
jgi:hypothetical protein